MIEATFIAHARNGVLVFDDPARAVAWLATAKDLPLVVTLERAALRRTLAQNRRWWKAIIPFASTVLEQKYNRKYNKDRTHDVLCRAFLGETETEIGKRIVHERRSSAKTTIPEFTLLMDEADQWIQEDFQVSPDLILADEDHA